MKRKHIARKIFAMTIAATMCMGLSPAGSVLAASDQMVSYTAVQADPTQPTTQEPATTQADTNTKDDKDTQSETVTLNIDNENQYDGMEKPYAQGYVPINANGSVRIVFPILSEGELRGNTLRAALDLGDAQTAPFVFKNYEKDIRLQTVKVNANTKEVSAYVADFTVELKGKRTNGSYPVILKVTAKDTKGNAVEQEFTTYVTISDGIDPDATTEAVAEPVAEELPTFAPKVMVKSYKYSKSEIQPVHEILHNLKLRHGKGGKKHYKSKNNKHRKRDHPFHSCMGLCNLNHTTDSNDRSIKNHSQKYCSHHLNLLYIIGTSRNQGCR